MITHAGKLSNILVISRGFIGPRNLGQDFKFIPEIEKWIDENCQPIIERRIEYVGFEYIINFSSIAELMEYILRWE